jgi:hypothetical protein
MASVVPTAWYHGTGLRHVAGLGGSLPFVTRAFFSTRIFWWLVPVAFALVSFDVLRRRKPSLLYFVLVLAGSTLAAFTMHVWIREAMYAPLFEILRKIG